jgi:hypothetical protein
MRSRRQSRMYYPRFNVDGLSTPLVIPPAFDMAEINMVGVVSDWD